MIIKFPVRLKRRNAYPRSKVTCSLVSSWMGEHLEILLIFFEIN